MTEKLTGAELIAQERQRQIEKEGWTAEHDDEHMDGDLAMAGAAYAADAGGRVNAENLWPWPLRSYKPTPADPIHQLAKAGALIAAEIDRLQRDSLIAALKAGEKK